MPLRTFRLSLVFVVVLLAVAACRKGADKSDELYDSTKTQPSKSPVTIAASDNSYSVILPARWFKLFRVDSLSSAERGTARPGAMNIVYLPRDTTQLPQTLLVIAVYDSVAWQRLRSAAGPTAGDSVAAAAGRVYVMALAQSNPFSPGSADAAKFDSLALTAMEKASVVKVNAAR